MNLTIEHVRDIHAIAEELIVALEREIASRGITEGNVALDAVINCLCYTMKRTAPPMIEHEDLLRRVTRYLESMDLPGAPGSLISRGNKPGDTGARK